ncbi:MAG: ABC transporter substrate-binding protein [Treponema sp.]|jgi:ribose transport system substrate-binding protein|nr:ABC transporter substrate-binding protein [Treponema sp.]
MKKMWSVFTCALPTLVLLLGCGGQTEDVDQGVFIPMISMGFQHQYWQAVNQGAQKAAAELGVTITFEAPELETQVDKQLEMFDAALSKKPAAICIAPLDAIALIPLLEKARSAGIPVICFDAGAESDIPVSLCATDNYGAAAAAADEMAKLINEQGEVAIIGYSQTSTDGIARVSGFKDTAENKYPNIKIVSIQYGDGDPLKSTEITKALLQANPNLKAIYAANEGSAIGMVNGTKEVGKVGQVILAGFDSGSILKDAVRDGTCAGAITQNPVGIGYETIQTAYKAYKGETVPKEVDTGFYWYTAQNMDDPAIAPCLYD